jgi:hypothetical protein
MPRTFRDWLAYLTILAVSFGGAVHASKWTIVAGAAILMLASLQRRHNEPVAVGPLLGTGQTGEVVRLVATMINGTAASCAAFLLGQGAALLWGL